MENSAQEQKVGQNTQPMYRYSGKQIYAKIFMLIILTELFMNEGTWEILSMRKQTLLHKNEAEWLCLHIKEWEKTPL